jgi:hypothetical protein
MADLGRWLLGTTAGALVGGFAWGFLYSALRDWARWRRGRRAADA